MEKKVAYMVAASMRYQPSAEKDKKGRIVVNGWFILKIKKTLFGREKFKAIGYYKKYTEAVAALNKIYGL